jgi:CheY-like chemotaxis protein
MSKAKMEILIVDDDELLRMSLSQLFIAFGHRVRSSEDGFSALREIQKAIPDILLSDLDMPRMSGFELISIVRRQFPTIRVIAMSSAFSSEVVPHGLSADAFHAKGTNVGSLLQLVGTMRTTSRRRRAGAGSGLRRTA